MKEDQRPNDRPVRFDDPVEVFRGNQSGDEIPAECNDIIFIADKNNTGAVLINGFPLYPGDSFSPQLPSNEIIKIKFTFKATVAADLLYVWRKHYLN